MAISARFSYLDTDKKEDEKDSVTNNTTPILGYEEETHADRVAFAARMGFADTWRGVKQLLGTDEEQMARDQRRLNMYLRNEQYGGSIMAAYTAGLFGDPVGWFLPGMKAKNLASATKAGLIAGGIVGATGYADKESGMTRLNNTLIGIAGGGVLSPAMYKFNKTMIPALKSGYSNMGEAIDTGKVAQDIGNISKVFSTVGAKVGAPAYGQVKRAGRWTKETKIGKTIGGYVVDNFGLPDNYVVAKQNKRMAMNKWAGDFNDVLEKFNKLPEKENRALYRLMTDDKLRKEQTEILTPDIRGLGKEGRTLVNSLGKELVDLGLLDKKLFEANKKKYLYRSYEKFEGPNKKRIIRDEGTIGVIGSEFARRGINKTFWKRKGETIADVVKRGEADGYRVIKKTSRSVDMNKDYTRKQRDEMGEVVSATFAMAKTGKLMSNDVALFRFYDDISKMDDAVIASTKVRPEDVPEGFKQIPDEFIRIGGDKTKVKRFGALSGRYVSPEVHRDIIWANRFKRYSQDDYGGLAKLHHKTLQYWKRTKTSLNPVVHMNNVIANFVMYDWVDASYKNLRFAAKDFWKAHHPDKSKRVKSDDFREAEKLGVFNADIMKRELTNHEVGSFNDYMKLGKQDDAKLLDSIWERTKKYANKTHMDELYSAEDSLFRLGLFKDRKYKLLANNPSMSAEEAAQEAARLARKEMLDYEIDAPFIQLMRESVMPFISYTYRAAPIMAETMLKRPWKIAKWGLILGGANQLVTDDEEFRTERKRQKELDMGFNILAIPGANTLIKVPSAISGDKSQYLDVSRWIPAGDVLQVKEQGFRIPGVPAPFQPSGGAVGGVTKAVLGFDTFTGQKQPGVGSGSMKDEWAARVPGLGGGRDSILGKEFIPMWNQYWNIHDAFESGGKRHPTKDDRTITEAMLNTIGIKVKTYDEKKMKTRVHYKYQNKIDSLNKKIRKMMANKKGGRIDSASFDKDLDRLKAELKKISKEAREALKKAK